MNMKTIIVILFALVASFSAKGERYLGMTAAMTQVCPHG